MKYIETGWQSYRALLPKDASEIQLKETRQAFFGGAALLLEAIMKSLEPGVEATANDLQVMEDVQAELDAFGREMDKRYAGRG